VEIIIKKKKIEKGKSHIAKNRNWSVSKVRNRYPERRGMGSH
jgi:hypothetical protein